MPRVYEITETDDDGSIKRTIQIDTSLPITVPLDPTLNKLLEKFLNGIVEKKLKLDGVTVRQI